MNKKTLLGHYNNGEKMFIIILKTLILYIFILVSYRIMGKKEIGELNIIDFIVTILIAELAAISIEEEKINILKSIVPITSLVIVQITFSYISMKSNRFRDFIDGKPSVIIKKGKLVFSQMSKLKYTLDDLLCQLREKGIKNIEEVDYAILENNGQLSVFQNTKDYPIPIIKDGIINYEVLKEIGVDKYWLSNFLLKNNLELDDIFYAFYKRNKTYIIRKSELI